MNPETHGEAHRNMIRARAALILEHPFFGHLALRMKLVADPHCDTAWSDGRTLAYNPLYVGMLPSEKVTGLLGHLVMHPACRHHLRRKGRDPRRWNMACDYAINWILLEAGLSLPDGYLDDPDLRGKTADEIYARLAGGTPPGEARDRAWGNRAGDGEEEKRDAPARPGTRPRTGDGGDDPSPPSPEGDGGESDRRDEDEEGFDHADPGGSGEVRDAPPPEDGSSELSEGETEETEWRIALAQAAQRARRMGDLPAGLARMVGEILGPKLDWRRLLHRFIQDSARHDYAWTPPNRRYLHQGLYLPSMRGDELPELVVAVDTSGSVSPRELDAFAAEISAILEARPMSLHVLHCDARVVQARSMGWGDGPILLNFKGGGGTDFRPAFAWVEERGLSPRCMIYLTDMACDRFPLEPPYPVLWVRPGGEFAPPPFGEVLSLA